MRNKSFFPQLCLTFGAALLLQGTSQAAVINFQGFTINPANGTGGVNDVVTTGTLVQATNWANSAQTVNTVAFTASGQATSGAPALTYGNFSFTNFSNTNTGAFNSGAASFTNLAAEYKGILVGCIYRDTSGTSTVTLNNLNVGQQYLVQFWTSDPRNGTAPKTQSVTSAGGNTVVMDFNDVNADGGLGQYVIGTFTADSASQNFSITGPVGSVQQINSMQLRAVPEPSIALLGGLGLLGLLRRRRN